MRTISQLTVCSLLVLPASGFQTWEHCDTLFTFEGEGPADFFGWIVANARDVDGDGTNDLLVGAPFHDPGVANAGRAYVYSGATGALLHTFDGDQVGAQAGLSLAYAGDLDQDGHADVIVGAPTPGGVGTAWVYSGQSGALLHEWTGENVGDSFGTAVGGGGDLDGDGVDDLLVGAMGHDVPGVSDAGRTYGFSGATGAVLFLWDGSDVGGNFGQAVGFLGDRDGDGHDDVVIGAPGAGPAGQGEAFVYSGLDGSLVFHIVPSSPTAVIFGGWFTDFAGDLDGDGVMDFIVADCQDQAMGPNTGSVSAYSGASGALLFLVVGEAQGDGHCAGPGWMGDYDGDGVDDLVFGSWRASHATTSLGGKVRIHSGTDGHELGRWSGSVQGDQLGYDSAGVGDLDGDGWPEVMASATPYQGNRGRVHVLSGRPLLPANECSGGVNSTGQSARMRYRRSWSLAENDWRVRVEGAVPGQGGVFFAGTRATRAPFGDGTLCIDGPWVRLAGGTVTASGSLQEPVDLSAWPVAAGSTWWFQFWYRDPAGGGSGFNLSDALRGTFCP